MVAKVDEDEVLAGWRQQSVLILGLILGCLMFVGSVAAVLWQRNEKRHYLARLRLEQDRRTSEIIFRKMFESMSELAVLHELVVDGNGKAVDYRILDCNPTFSRVTGIAREAAVGELASKVYGTGAPFLEAYAKVAQMGESVSMDAYFEPMGKWFSISAVCPQPGRFATIALDITDRKLAEQERERLNNSLREKNEELEALLYAASHDLRSPLVNIEGFGKRLEKACLELGEMLKHSALPEELRARAKVLVEDRITTALRYSRSGVAKMSNLINGLLVLSRLGRASLAITAVDMDRLMEQTLDAMRFQIQQASARVIVDPLPGCLGDAGFLGQVFSNLLDNALKYRDSGRVLEIRISGMVIGGEAIYKVADTGVGIDPASQVKIWELFHRLNPEGPVQGEGLGLNLVMRMVRMQRGRVWVESEPGRGSRFFVALPKVEV
jgi:signal transduction histidine kinase